jgi:hypothetical protein
MMELPAQCALDQRILADVAEKVNKISQQLDNLESRTGPIAAHDLRIGMVEGSAARAHERLDTHRVELDELAKANTSLQIRLGVVLVPIASAVGAIVAKLL